MSAQLAGLLYTPHNTAHVVVFRTGFLSIFMPPYEADDGVPGAVPTLSDLNRWVAQAVRAGVETAAIIQGVPFPVTTYTKLGATRLPSTEIRGMVQQPWHGLIVLMLHRFQGDCSAPLPEGYRFVPAVSTQITRMQAAEC